MVRFRHQKVLIRNEKYLYGTIWNHLDPQILTLNFFLWTTQGHLKGQCF